MAHLLRWHRYCTCCILNSHISVYDWLTVLLLTGPVACVQRKTYTLVVAAVVDILDIKWETLVSEEKPKPVIPGSALRRFTAHHILREIGVSAAFAGDALLQRLKSVCQQEMDDEAARLAAAAADDG